MKSTEFLIHEHKIILRALDVLEAMNADAKNITLKARDFAEVLDFLRWFADAHHQAKEETILFPALKAAAGVSQGRPVEHMLFEHGQERSLIEAIETDLRLANETAFADHSERLCSLLRNHIYKEDTILFDTADAVLTVDDDDQVFDNLSRFDTPLDKQLLGDKLKRLQELEWKYLRK